MSPVLVLSSPPFVRSWSLARSLTLHGAVALLLLLWSWWGPVAPLPVVTETTIDMVMQDTPNVGAKDTAEAPMPPPQVQAQDPVPPTTATAVPVPLPTPAPIPPPPMPPSPVVPAPAPQAAAVPAPAPAPAPPLPAAPAQPQLPLSSVVPVHQEVLPPPDDVPQEAPLAAPEPPPPEPMPAAPQDAPADGVGTGLVEGSNVVPVAPDAPAPNQPPRYPSIARQRHEQGQVLLTVQIDATGSPTHVGVATSSGHASLDAAAVQAVSAWHFHPALQDGQPVAASMPLVIKFLLTDSGLSISQ